MHHLAKRPWRIIVAACLGSGVFVAGAAAPASASTAPAWSKLSPPTSPPALRGASAAYDSADASVVLFGGKLADGKLSDATWVWNGSTWSEVQPYGAVPPARELASMAFDSTLDQLILFGGEGAGGKLLDDTWVWNGASWNQIDPASTPGARDGAALTETSDGDLLLFGGYGTSNALAPTTPTTTTSTSTTTVAPSPPLTIGLPTGTSSTSTTTTTTLPPTTTPTTTPPSSGPSVLRDTWLLGMSSDGSDDWQAVPATTTAPPALAQASMASDGSDTVLFGGADARPGASVAGELSSATWEWTGTAWHKVKVASPPPARAGAVLSYDSDLSDLLLVGGQGAKGPLGDTWAFVGGKWKALAPSSPPAPREGALGAYDAASRQLVLFGGAASSGQLLAQTDVLTKLAPTRVTTTPTTTPPSAAGHHSTAGTVPGSRSTPTTSSTTTTRPTTGRTTPTTTRQPAKHLTLYTLHRGDLITLSGSGFLPDAQITITFHSVPEVVVATPTADASGAFKVTVSVPVDATIGMHHFVASGKGPKGTTTLITEVRVVALAVAQGISAASTGALTAIAIAIPLGTWLVFGAVNRARRRSLRT